MLQPGARLGPYEILGSLGAGGMGEVYRARDPRLGREVAIKVLPLSMAGDSERLRRFEQEARAAGKLNHPHVLSVFDLGRHDGFTYIVSELLEGETLRQRLRRERLPVRKAVEWATQIARGLAAAHDRGIVHRDLKPENLIITRDGHVKILDFGLAKLTEAEAVAAEATVTLHTDAGLVLGTAAYMSPEQARGIPTDHRTDIFSFGAILYEMLSGVRAFERATSADTISAILKEHPPTLSESGRNVPPALERIVDHCLEKDRDERFHSMRDVAFALEGISAASSTSAMAPPAVTSARWKRVWPLAALLLVAVAGAAYLTSRNAAAPSAGAPISFQRLTDFVGVEESPAISPDGKSVALSGGSEVPHIWVRLLAGGPPLQITRDPAPHLEPRWSPDSASLIYFTPSLDAKGEGTIFEIPALGGPARRLVSAIAAGDISHDGKNLAYFRAAPNNKVELAVADRDGSNPRVLAALPASSLYSCLRWSPDDSWLAFQRGDVFDFDIYAIPTAGGEPRALTHDHKDMQGFAWWPDGKGIVFSSSRGHTILYLPTFNLWSMSLDGKRVRQLTFGEISYAQPDMDSRGRLVASRVLSSFNIWKFPVSGAPEENVRHAVQITSQTGHVQNPSVSPDGREVVYLSDSGGHPNLWVIKLDGSAELRQITFEQNPDVSVGVPVWSPDGKQITFFVSKVSGSGQERAVQPFEQWLVAPDGSNLRRLTDKGGWAAWSPDSRWLYTSPPTQGGQAAALFKVPVEGGDAVLVRKDGAQRSAPAPDGHTLYFTRFLGYVGGGTELEIDVASPENGPARLLARLPAWRVPFWQMPQPVISPDGKWLAVMLKDGAATNLYAVPTDGGPLRQITDFKHESTVIARRVSWSADSRFLFAAVGRTDADIVMLEHLLP